MRATFRRAALVNAFALAAATPALPQDVSFRPVFSLGVAYDSNIFLRAQDAIGDSFGAVTLELPLQYKISRRSSLRASYIAGGEWYQDQTQLDDFPTRQDARLTYDYDPERGFTFALRGAYRESQRPEEVFADSGIDFGRQRARSASGGTSLGHSLGQRGRLGLDYDYARSLYREDQEETEYHQASVALGRELGPRTRVEARYAYQHYLFSLGLPEESTQISRVGTLGLSRSFGQRTTLSLRGGVRFTQGATTPEVEADLARSWRGGSLSASYAHTQAFVPAREAQRSLSEVDRASLSLSFRGRRYRVSLSPSYYRNRLDDLRTETWRGAFDATYKFARWLGLSAHYQYTFQESTEVLRDQAKRHLVRVGIVISPWADAAGFAAPTATGAR